MNAHHLPGHPGLKLLRRGESMTLGFNLQYKNVQQALSVP
ncbi:Aldose 1-epimerase [Pseudomonas syringae pv. coriandricola]|uniref:Aldose 1-epimerase n=1 Tax=Pseudomonas syringae pv. coriandricola TaxID=264453 RepID=A0A0P9NQ31_9PSED|nr:Aldose 1-epimerase [Pseudomonas syringae pv. coriandricola]RMN08922.1 Aldose 1-epimerase [Pseudomonas syringae pv. coriandricola]